MGSDSHKVHQEGTPKESTAMCKPQHLFRSSTGLYYYRRKIPTDLLPSYGGRKQIKESLKTHDPDTAYERVRVKTVESDQEFAQRRKVIAKNRKRKPTTDPVTMSETEMMRRAVLMKQSMLEADDEARFEGDYADEQDFTDYLKKGEERLEGLRRAYGRGDTSDIKHYVQDWLEGVEAIPRNVELEFLKARIEATEIQLARKAGKVIPTLVEDEGLRNFAEPSTLTKPKGNGITLKEVFKKYVQEREPKAKTAQDYDVSIQRFLEVLKVEDIELSAVTATHIRTYKDALLLLPSRPSKKLTALTVPEIIEATKDKTISRLSPKTINDKALAALRAVFGYAVRNGHCDLNPALGIKVEMSLRKKQSGSDRQPYSIEDMNRIFRFPIYSKGDRPIGGRGEAAYWLPLLAAFTGARLEELGLTTKEDIKNERGVDYIDLTTREETKTETSKRRIPIHPELIELGFMEFVKGIKSGRLFPEVTSNQDKETASWSQWWGRYARKHGGFDSTKVFHSFRHAAKDGFREGDVAPDLRDALMGHAPRTVGETYGAGHSLNKLAEAMERLVYPGLDLSHLKK